MTLSLYIARRFLFTFLRVFGVFFGVGERQRGTPGTAENLPLFNADHFAQTLDVGDQMPCRVGFD